MLEESSLRVSLKPDRRKHPRIVTEEGARWMLAVYCRKNLPQIRAVLRKKEEPPRIGVEEKEKETKQKANQ